MEITASLEQTKSLARELALAAKKGDCFCLTGDLGAGKTEFARAFIQTLAGNDITVASPTFNILQVYDMVEPPIYHFDLYRIEEPNELNEIGLDDALNNGISLIEWPQVAEDYLPRRIKRIHIEILDENTRRITVK